MPAKPGSVLHNPKPSSYTVVHSTSVDAALVCEGSCANLACGEGQAIMVMHADFGRTSREACVHWAMERTDCSADVTDAVRRVCHGRRTCDLCEGVDGVGGDVFFCENTFKVRWECEIRKKDVKGDSDEFERVCPVARQLHARSRRAGWASHQPISLFVAIVSPVASIST